METKIEKKSFKLIGNVEKYSVVVLLILALGNYLLTDKAISIGILIGGAVFIVDVIVIKIIVKLITESPDSLVLTIVLFIIKFLILVLIVALLFKVAKVNIYGFIIGLTAVVIVIIGSGLKGLKHGTF